MKGYNCNEHTDGAVAKPFGLHCLRSRGHLSISDSQKGFDPSTQGSFLRVPKRQYNDAINLLLKFIDYFYIKNPNQELYFAWIYSHNSVFIPYPPALASKGMNLKNIVFLESSAMLQTLQMVCADNIFAGILFDDYVNSKAISIAKRWVKPHSQPQIFKGENVSSFGINKIFIFMD